MTSKNVQERGTLRVMRQVGLPELLRRARFDSIGEPRWSLRESARRTGLAVNTVKLIEQGDTALPSRDVLALLADAYELDLDDMARAAYGTYFEEASDTDSARSPRRDAVTVSS